MHQNYKKRLWVFILALPCLCFSTGHVFGQDPSYDGRNPVFRKLEINRALMVRFEKEYLEYKKDEIQNPSALLRRKIEGTQYKIKGVKDDLRRLESSLTTRERANEFVKDLICERAPEISGPSQDREIAARQHPAGPADKEAAAKRIREKILKNISPSNSKNAQKLSDLHERALRLVSRNKFKEAEAVYQEILLLNPDDDQAYIILGHIYLLSGEYEKSERSFHNAIEIDPQDINDITPFYENLIMRNPSDDMAYAHLGYAYLMLDRVADAKQAFHDALQINPDNYSARNGLGILMSAG